LGSGEAGTEDLRKQFFFEKKNQKTFAHESVARVVKLLAVGWASAHQFCADRTPQSGRAEKLGP
jgi:hypothetical protein